MPALLSIVQVFLVSVLFCQYMDAFPTLGSDVEYDDSLLRMDSRSCRRCWFPRDSEDSDGPAVEDRGRGRLELQTRQLGDLEFASRYAEMLKSKAKISSLCSFLRRMQNSKKRYIKKIYYLKLLYIPLRLHGVWAVMSVYCIVSTLENSTPKNGLPGDTERVNTLLKQYMCANVYQ